MNSVIPDIRPIPWTPKRLIGATGGTLACGQVDQSFHRVSIDSRTIDSGDLFVAIKGANHDGHDFVPMVLDKNVTGFVVHEKNTEAIGAIRNRGGLCIAVKNTIRALGDMAADQKTESKVTLAAITGSNGKTSTRTMTSCVLEQGLSTLSTQGNFNNDIGLPLTLLRLSKDYQWAVVEMGMNAPGEIARLAEIARPDIGVVTQVAAAHLEGLGSIENVAKAKAELLDALEPGHQALLNLDDPMFSALSKHCRCKILTFGTTDKADIRATAIRLDQDKVTFTLNADGKQMEIGLHTPARIMVTNALAAAGVGLVAGLSMETIKKGLESFKPVYGRMRIIESRTGFFVIDDTYNANPQSMMAAIDTLCDLKGNGKGVAVLGDMFELGKDSEALHRKVGTYAAEKGIRYLYACGEKARLIAESAIAHGVVRESVFTGTKKEIIGSLSGKLEKSDWVLVKGSRSMAMEEIVNDLLMLNGA